MKSLFLRGLCLFAVLVIASETAAVADDLQGAIDKIAAKTKGVKAFSADMSMTMQGKQAMNMTGHIDCLVPDKVRMAMSMPNNMGDQTTVSNGTVTWMIVQPMGMCMRIDMVKVKAALKEAGLADPSSQHNVASPLAMFDTKTLRLTGTEKCQGKECWVFEGSPKSPQTGAAKAVSSARIFVATDDGILRKMELRDNAGNTTIQVTYEKIVLNPDLDAKLFEYQPAADAKIMDQTETMIRGIKMRAAKPDANKGE